MLNLVKTKTLEQENAISSFCAKMEKWKFECKSSKALVVCMHKTINFFAIVCISGWTWRDVVVFRVFANIEPSIAWQILGLTQGQLYYTNEDFLAVQAPTSWRWLQWFLLTIASMAILGLTQLFSSAFLFNHFELPTRRPFCRIHVHCGNFLRPNGYAIYMFLDHVASVSHWWHVDMFT
jgi:hypothetical protein